MIRHKPSFALIEVAAYLAIATAVLACVLMSVRLVRSVFTHTSELASVSLVCIPALLQIGRDIEMAHTVRCENEMVHITAVFDDERWQASTHTIVYRWQHGRLTRQLSVANSTGITTYATTLTTNVRNLILAQHKHHISFTCELMNGKCYSSLLQPYENLVLQ